MKIGRRSGVTPFDSVTGGKVTKDLGTKRYPTTSRRVISATNEGFRNSNESVH